MYKRKTLINVLPFLILLIVSFFGCSQSTEEEIEYSFEIKEINMAEPLFSNMSNYLFTQTTENIYSITIDNNQYYINTNEYADANTFVNNQENLLKYLRKYVEINDLTFYVSNYEKETSDFQNKKGYYNYTYTKTYKQIILTLQMIYGDYTNYGYLYSVANRIADDLNWKTDNISSGNNKEIKLFIENNTEILNLVYPCFTLDYSDANMITKCKQISMRLFKKLEYKDLLKKTIDDQLSLFYKEIDEYAKDLGISFIRQTYLYANYGLNHDLKVKTDKLEIFFDKGYIDIESLYADCFKNLKELLNNIDIMNNETTSFLNKFSLYEEAESINVFFYNKDTSSFMYGNKNNNFFDGDVHLTTISGFSHEYYHYIESLVSPNHHMAWQSQAFCEWGALDSYYRKLYCTVFEKEGVFKDFFKACFNREIKVCKEDVILLHDSFCYLFNSYDLDYYYGRDPIISFTNYLMNCYSEEIVFNLLLNYAYDDASKIIDKTWRTLQDEWTKQNDEKFEHIDREYWYNLLLTQ